MQIGVLNLEPIIWEIYVVNPDDLGQYYEGLLKWSELRKVKISVLVDTGAGASIFYEEYIKKVGCKISAKKVNVQGLCQEPVELRVALAGIGLEVNGEILTIRKDILIIPEEMKLQLKRLIKSLEDLNAYGILGRDLLDGLSVMIDPIKKTPRKVTPLLI